MKLKPLTNWGNLKDLEPLLFFAQRLDELLFDYSLDTYKAPALNAPYLCLEAINLIEDIEANNIDASNLEHVLAELEWSLGADPVAKTLIGNDLSMYFLGENAKTQLQKQKVFLELIQKSIAPDLYLLRIQESLVVAIAAHQKVKINSLARTWVTTLVNYGVSKAYLYQLVNRFFFGTQKIEALADAKTFFIEALPYLHEFQVYFVVGSDIKNFASILENFDIKVLDSIPEDLKSLALQNKFELSASEVILEVSSIKSYDVHSGRREAEQQLERVRDLALLYSHKRPIAWQNIALVRQCCLDTPVVTLAPMSSIQKITDLRPHNAAPRLSYLVENLSLNSPGDREKFDRIVDLHGLCAIQEAPETQLLNLWICIESLIPTEPTRNKITNIIEMALPILLLIYVRRLIKNLLNDLLEWDKKYTQKTLRKIDCTSEEWLALKVLMLLAPDNEAIRKEFYEKLENFPLLRNRIFSMAEMFSSAKKLSHMLSEHRKKLEWQLRRIYRTRNLIVHSGRSPSYIPTLIENAHDYLDGMLFEIMQASCGAKRLSTFKQAFEMFKIQHFQFERQLREMVELNSKNISNIYYLKQPRKTVGELFQSHAEMLAEN